jgi:hypothetical protein
VTDIPLAVQRELIRQQWARDAALLSGAPIPSASGESAASNSVVTVTNLPAATIVGVELPDPSAEQVRRADPVGPSRESDRGLADSRAAGSVPAPPGPRPAPWQIPDVPAGQREVLQLIRSSRLAPDAVLTSRDPDARALPVRHGLEAAAGMGAARARQVMEAAAVGHVLVGDLASGDVARLLAALRSPR